MLKSKLLLSILLIISLVIPIGAQSPNSQQTNQDDSVIKIGTQLVNLDVQVINKKNNIPVKGLTIDNFEIYEDGVKQTISNFSQDQLPLSVLVLLDVSGSVEGISTELKEATIKALNSLKPEDEVSLMAFATGTGQLNSFTKNKQAVIDSVEEIRRKTIAYGKGTDFNNAVFDAIDHMKKYSNPTYRKAVIAITDNILSLPPDDEKKKVINKLLESDISINALLVEDSKVKLRTFSFNQTSLSTFGSNGFVGQKGGGGGGGGGGRPPAASPPARTPTITRNTESSSPALRSVNTSSLSRDVVDEYVKETGGEIVDARKTPLVDRFTELVSHLRARYSLAYISSNSNNKVKLRKLKVKVVSAGKEMDDIVIKTKKGYFSLPE